MSEIEYEVKIVGQDVLPPVFPEGTQILLMETDGETIGWSDTDCYGERVAGQTHDSDDWDMVTVRIPIVSDAGR